MNIGQLLGPGRCSECNSKGPGLSEMELRFLPGVKIILCPACVVTVEKVLKAERDRPHMREERHRDLGRL